MGKSTGRGAAGAQPPTREGAAGAAPWLEAAEPGLLTNKLVRDFLSRYAPQDWAEVVKLLVIHGITSLHASHGCRLLSLPELKRVVGEGQVADTLKDDMPSIQSALSSLQDKVASLCSGFGVGAQPEVGATEALDQSTAAAPRSAGAALAEGAARRVPPLSPALCDGVGAALRDEQPKLASPQAMAGWRMYPDWWGDGECVEVGAKPRPQNRPAPRLAYGAATKPPPQKVPVEDDLVTAAYLGVPSSGYGKTKTKPVSHAKEAIAARREQLRRRKREALVEATSRRAARDRGDRADADREASNARRREDGGGGETRRRSTEEFAFPLPSPAVGSPAKAVRPRDLEASLAANPWMSCFLGPSNGARAAVARRDCPGHDYDGGDDDHMPTNFGAPVPASPPRSSIPTAPPLEGLREEVWERVTAAARRADVVESGALAELEAPMWFPTDEDSEAEAQQALDEEGRAAARRRMGAGWVGDFGHLKHSLRPPPRIRVERHYDPRAPSAREPERSLSESESESAPEAMSAAARALLDFDDEDLRVAAGWEGTLAAWGEQLPGEYDEARARDRSDPAPDGQIPVEARRWSWTMPTPAGSGF
eukprot:jgi/Tetstr1/440530/TSEL_028853.t1